MIKRTIEIATPGVFCCVRDDQLVIRPDKGPEHTVPIEDIAVLILATARATYTHSVITRLLAAGAVIVACDDRHVPAGLLLPQNNALQTQRIARQIAAAKPLHKRLWKQIVVAKITHQAHVLGADHRTAKALLAMRSRVRSGDPGNVEAQAARRYWPALFGRAFRRRPQKGGPVNALLNYGYMALRAAVARAVCAAGLHPSLGIHHHNRADTFALADDLLEPLRPMVDRRVKRLVEGGCDEINGDAKRELLGVLTGTVRIGGATGPLLVSLERMAASLVHCYAGDRTKLDLPSPWT